MWKHFTFTSGCNPYITTDDKKANAAIKRWRKNGFTVEKIQEGFYIVNDSKPETDLFGTF